ncbi:MAG: ThiF family adenylyltransferase [Planctomycetes bacterium]|nr:ThiF family adenylyltransferase [Planctomycetota bacterium]
MSSERYSRQADIVPRQRILDCKATVIGVGAIGRQVAIQLTAIGVPHIQLVDFDLVDISNLTTQGYMYKDLKHPKVDVTAEFCRQINYDLQVEVVLDKFKRSTPVGNTVFCCVDSITARKHIWDAVKDKVNFFVDGRMSAEALRIVTACDDISRSYYTTTLFAAEEAHAGPCTAKSTIYCANIAAGFMLAQFTKYLRLMPVDPDIQVNLLASEINVGQV